MSVETKLRRGYINKGERPFLELTLSALTQSGHPIEINYSDVEWTNDDYQLKAEGPADSLTIFNQLHQTSEFDALRNLFTRTEHAYLPGEVYRQEHGYEDRPVTFYRTLAACGWDDFLKSRVISRYWENEAENWRFAAQEMMGVAKGAFLTETLGASQDERYNLGQKIGIGCLASLISPFGLMGLAAGLYGKREYSQNANACLAVAKSIRKPFDRLKDEEIPDLLVPPINRVKSALLSN